MGREGKWGGRVSGEGVWQGGGLVGEGGREGDRVS